MSMLINIGDKLKADLQVRDFVMRRASDIVSPGVIHYEIWDEIRNADIIIAEVSGHNPNVMFELGVSAAIKDKQRVILVQEKGADGGGFPFDMVPARHLVYTRSLAGYQALAQQLYNAIFQSLVRVPFDEMPLSDDFPSLPFSANLDDGRDSMGIRTSDQTHRRMLSDCLEFGSLYSFRNTRASIGNLKLASVRVQAEMRITLVGDREPPDEWLGISLRNQGWYANYGWLIHVYRNGKIVLAIPKNEQWEMDSNDIGVIRPLDGRDAGDFVKFDVAFTDDSLEINVDEFHRAIPVGELPFVGSRGRVLFQGAFCRVGIRRVQVQNPDLQASPV